MPTPLFESPAPGIIKEQVQLLQFWTHTLSRTHLPRIVHSETFLYLSIQKNSTHGLEVVHGLSQVIQCVLLVLVSAMGEVETGHIHAGFQQLLQDGARPGADSLDIGPNVQTILVMAILQRPSSGVCPMMSGMSVLVAIAQRLFSWRPLQIPLAPPLRSEFEIDTVRLCYVVLWLKLGYKGLF